MPRLRNFALVAGVAALTIYAMVVGQAILLPLVVSVAVWYLINVLAHSLRRVPLLRLPRRLCLAFAVILFLGLAWMVGDMVASNLGAIATALPAYESRLDAVVRSATGWFGLDEPLGLAEVIGGFDIKTLASRTAAALASVASNAGLVLIYVLFLLLEQGGFERKLAALFRNPEKEAEAKALLAKIGYDLQTYMRIKLLLSLLLALYGFLVLQVLAVDFAGFWAALIFLFNFIPTIGWIVSLTGPALFALLQFDDITPFLVVSLGIGVVQVAVNNFVEPALMGRSLNLSPFVIILSLVVFGTLWGLVGMVLSVPIMVAVLIVLAHFRKTRGLAVLMSANGEISDQEVDSPPATRRARQAET